MVQITALTSYGIYCITRAVVSLINLIPHPTRVAFFGSILRHFTHLSPKYRKITAKNMELALADKPFTERSRILDRSANEMGRLISDCLRLEHLTDDWVREHIDIPYLPRYRELKSTEPERGILFVTGHLGSFDLLAYSIGLLGYPLHFVARRFKNPFLDKWFMGIRERTGNTVIPREGAVRKILKAIERGHDVGILFDQNVTRKHAVFVDWFGRSAATTVAPAIAAITTGCRVVVVGMSYKGNDHYRILCHECDFADITGDETLERSEKIELITAELSREFQKLILSFPEGWFWIHRRWKTAPEGMDENFYNT